MAQALRRILRFRQLAEEQARLEVERAVQSLRRASAACERQVAAEQEQRVTLAASWKLETVSRRQALDGDGESALQPVEPAQAGEFAKHMEQATAENTWLMEEATLEFFGLQRMRLEQLREAETRRIEPMIARYKEHRRELRQTEQLLAQQAAVENMEKDRRAQAETDEWFLQRSLAGRRREQRLERAAQRPRKAEE
ncbi:MAG: hypothetical protein WA708_04820 [Acidobacteriaceae bacterium]